MGEEAKRAGEGDSEGSAFGWLLGFVRPYSARLGAILALSLVTTGLGLAQPYITKYLIDDGLIAGRIDVVIWLAALVFAAAVVASLLGALNRWHYVDVSARILFALRGAVYAHLQRLSPTFYARRAGGDIMARLDGDVAEIQRFAVDSLLALVNGGIALLGALALMVSLSWQLSLVALVLLPAEFLFLRVMRARVERRTRTVRERASDLTSFFFDTLPAMKFIQSVGAEGRMGGRLSGLQDLFRLDMLRLQMTNYVTGAVPGLMTSFSTALVFIAGGYMMIEGRLTLGTLIAFSVYLGRATGPLQTLLGLYVASRRARVSLDRVMELRRERPAVESPAAPRSLPSDAAGALSLERVSFRYDGDSPPVLRGGEVAIPAGAKVGLAGESGVGKTTLIDLLQRHFDPDEGSILLDGVDLRALDLGELRRRVAVVAQDTVLFSGSVIDNIRFAAPDASDADVRRAAALARVDEFVEALPQGYETDIGQRGTALSGGQRQRLAIARALLQDPLVLVLDEATSAVDRETEIEITEAIDRLFPGVTRIIISHRPGALEGVDMVVELEDGRLGAQGTG